MKHFFIRLFLITFSSVLFAFLSIFFISKSFATSLSEQGNYAIQEDVSDYYDAISYGIVNNTKSFSAQVVRSPSLSMKIVPNAKLQCHIGVVSANQTIYTFNGESFCFDHDVVIEEIDFFKENILLTYHLYKEDYIVFSGNKYDYQSISLNSWIQLENYHTTLVADREIVDQESYFESKHDDFSFLEDETKISVIIKSMDNCYFISNSFLTEKTGDKSYLLHIYNKYVGDQLFYDREITVERFSNLYSIITSGNVFPYEKVLLKSYGN